MCWFRRAVYSFLKSRRDPLLGGEDRTMGTFSSDEGKEYVVCCPRIPCALLGCPPLGIYDQNRVTEHATQQTLCSLENQAGHFEVTCMTGKRRTGTSLVRCYACCNAEEVTRHSCLSIIIISPDCAPPLTVAFKSNAGRPATRKLKHFSI